MPSSPQSVRVLVVANLADTLAGVLQLRGYDAIAVFNAKAALISGQSHCPDAIIAEIFWEQMADDLQLVTQLAEAFPSSKLILISGNVRKASRFLKRYNCPLLRRPTYPADILPFVTAVDEIVLGS